MTRPRFELTTEGSELFEFLSGFLFNPAMAVGTAAVASPILIHIFSRRRFRRIRWAAMEFLLEAQRRNRRRVRLDQLLLLLLRCLAILLIALMIMRPFVRPGLATTLIGVGPKTERIVLLDDSYSMSYRSKAAGGTGEQTVFKHAVEATESLARWIAQESSADPMSIVLASQPHQAASSVPSLSDKNLQSVHEFLAGATPTHSPSRMREAIAALANWIDQAASQPNVAVYIVSDFQRVDWVTGGDQGSGSRVQGEGKGDPSASLGAGRSPIAPLSDLATDRRSIKLVLLDTAAENPRNVAVTELRSVQPQSAAGVPARFEVAVANHTPEQLTNVEVSVSVSLQTLPPVVIPAIPAGQTARTPIEVAFPTQGSDYIRAELAGAAGTSDGLALDNVRALAVPVVSAIKVLIVDGEPSNDPYNDEVFLFRTALRPEGVAASGNDLSVIDEDEIDGIELDDYHVVVLANAFRLSDAGQKKVETFVEAGGGLIIFLGDQIDPEVYNERLYRQGKGLLPLPLTRLEEAPHSGDPFHFGEWDAGYPMMRAFAGPLGEMLRQVQVFAWFGVEEKAGSKGLRVQGSEGSETTGSSFSSPSDPQTLAPSPPSSPLVLARFSDPSRSPAMVLRPFGEGRVLLVTTSVDQEWNDWAANFSYVPMMLESVQHLARQPETPTQVLVGAPIVCPIEPQRYKSTAVVRTPAYPVDPEIPVEAGDARRDPRISPGTDSRTSPVGAAADAQIGVALRWSGTQRAGMYQFILTTNAGQPETRFAAVNPDAVESDLTRASQAELSSTLVEMKFEYLRDVSTLSSQDNGARRELWWPLLLAAVVVLMMEHGLAWWFGTRG